MAINSGVTVYSLVNVNLIKVDKDPNSTFTEKTKMGNTGLLYQNFDDGIDAFYRAPNVATSVDLYRRTPYISYYDYIGTLSDGSYTFNDNNISNLNYYHYLVSSSLVNSLGTTDYYIYENLQEDNTPVYIKTNWSTWSICDIAPTTQTNVYSVIGDVWLFSENLESGDISQKINITVYNTLGQYSQISKGVQNYDASQITCLLGKVSVTGANNYTEAINTDKYARNVEKMVAWKAFCADSYLKLLKDRKGNKWIVQINDVPTNKINDNTYQQISTISFTWQEVMDSSTVSIITPTI
jgi:hypothetical protein